MANNPLYTADALAGLESNLRTYSRSLPMADYLGTVCADPGIRPDDLPGFVKAYTTLGGLILPFDPTGMDEFSAMIATALLVKKTAGNDAEIMFIMGHENCKFVEAMQKVLLGHRDKFPIRARFIDALLGDDDLRGLLTEVVVNANNRGDDPALVVRVMTELMLLESLRNFRRHVVDNDADTIADYMDGAVAGVPRLNVLPALTLTTGEVIFFDPAAYAFVYKSDIAFSAAEPLPVEEVLDNAREIYINKIRQGDYSGLIITNESNNDNRDPRQLAPQHSGAVSCC